MSSGRPRFSVRVCEMTSTPLAIVKIGYQMFLLPRAKALKAAEIMGQAVLVNYSDRLDGSAIDYETGAIAEVSVEFINPSRLDLSGAPTEPAPRQRRSPKAITQQPLRIARK